MGNGHPPSPEEQEQFRSEWRRHVDAELFKLRENQHTLRNDLNAMALKQVEEMANLKEEILKGFTEIKVAIAEVKGTSSHWSALVTGAIAALPALGILIYLILNRIGK